MKQKEIPYKIYLEESEMPKEWYNVRADMKNKPAPLLNPQTLQPMTAEELGAVFCDELVAQELNETDPYIAIPEEIRSFYKMYRPSPLVRAYCLEEKLDTPAKIYYKFEGNNTSGSHKLNSAIAQAYYAKEQGLTGVTTETGAGQWGTALAMACAYFGLDCKVYMVKVSYEQKPFRREVMRTYGASVTPSPSMETEVGRKILAEHPGTTGSLGCAISEAVEAATHTPGYRYVLGSVLNQVLLHQSIIGLETKAALDKYGVVPDIIIGCAGGWAGSSPPSWARKSRASGITASSPWSPLPAPALPADALPMTSATRARSRRWLKCTPWAAPSSLLQTTPAASATTACPRSFPSCMQTSIWKQNPTNRQKFSKRPFSSPSWKRSFRHRNLHTRSAEPLTKH